MRVNNEVKKAINVEAQQALNTLFFLAGMRGGSTLTQRDGND